MAGKSAFVLMVVIAKTLANIHVQCRYNEDTNWFIIDDVYNCELNENLDIPDSNTQITSVSGQHTGRRTNADVLGFRVYNKTLNYLPHGLERHFNASKIILIAILCAGLKQINQSDLAPFTDLRFINLYDNQLEVIERDLFKFNTKIECIALGQNRIKFIDGTVFQNLKKLNSLFLKYNDCIAREAVLNRIAVVYLITTYQPNCTTDASIQ